MATEEKDNSSPVRGIEGGTPQQATPTSHTEIGSAEMVFSGPGANITINKASVQDFIMLYEHISQDERNQTRGEKIPQQEASQNVSGATVQAARTNAFISYSRADKKYLEELHTHLAPYVRDGMLNYWDDTKIKPGAKWFDEIKKGLQSAKIAVFLVSADFLASDFIARKELPALLEAASEEGTVILSIILRPCSFKYSELAQFQAVNAPSNPLSTMNSKGKRDEVWVKVAEQVKDALQLPD